MPDSRKTFYFVLIVLAFAVSFMGARAVLAQADFYKGKTITVYIGTTRLRDRTNVIFDLRQSADPFRVLLASNVVRQYVRLRKQALGVRVGPEPCVPQQYAWGDEAQVDWYEADADLTGLVLALVMREAVPYLAALRYADAGVEKRAEWEQYRREVTPYERQRYLGAL